MRHRRSRRRIKRNFSHRKQLLENMVLSLFEHQQIRTTWVKAKEAQKLADRLITLGKEASLHSKRRAYAVLGQHPATQKLFNEIAPRFGSRKGGYTRVLHMGHRKGDAAPMALLELTEKAVVETKAPKEKKEAQAKKAEAPSTETKQETARPTHPSKEALKQPLPKKGFFGNVRKMFRKRSQGE